MTRDEIIAEMTILIDRAFEAGYNEGWESGLTFFEGDKDA